MHLLAVRHPPWPSTRRRGFLMPTDQQVCAELARMTALFQARAIAAAMGIKQPVSLPTPTTKPRSAE